MNFKKRKRELLEKEVKRQPINVAVLCGASPGTLPDCLEIELLEAGFLPTMWQGGYARYFEDAMFGMEDFIPHIVYVYTTRHNIQYMPRFSDSEAEVSRMLKNEISRFKTMHDELKKRFGCVVIQNNFNLPPQLAVGGAESSDVRGMVRYINELNRRFYEVETAHIFDLSYFSSRLGLCNVDNATYMNLYKYAIAPNAEPQLAREVAATIESVFGRRKKVLVCDLDGTLWGGVFGDVGVAGLELGDTPKGEEYQGFQRFLKRLRDSGVLLCVASKNELETAKSGFSSPHSVLGLDDFVEFEASWNPKPDAVRRMSERLNLGLDSFVFVDDNPFERDFMRKNLAEVTVIEADSPQKMMEEICKLGLFNLAKITSEDTQRTLQYESEKRRADSVSQFESYRDYLLSLEMKVEFAPVNADNLARATQLINKTNQFNTTTLRLTEQQVESYANDENCITLTAKLADKFGNSGLVAVVLARIVDAKNLRNAQQNDENDVQNDEAKNAKKALEIELWVMSCRVFSRQLEHATLDEIVSVCNAFSVSEVWGSYIPTLKNKPVADLYERLGFEKITDTDIQKWRLDLKNYENRTDVMEVIRGE